MPDDPAYRLSDFLLFAPQTYFRLFERLNDDFLWLNLGLHALLLLAAVGIAVQRAPTAYVRLMALVLAAAWTWSAIAFVWRLYLPINWAMQIALPLLGLQVLLCVLLALRPGRLEPRPPGALASAPGWLLLALAAAYPLVAPLAGRGWAAAELFGSAPDATAIGSLALVLLLRGARRWALLPVPLLWAVFSVMVLQVMQAGPAAWLPAIAVVVAVGGLIVQAIADRGRTPAPANG